MPNQERKAIIRLSALSDGEVHSYKSFIDAIIACVNELDSRTLNLEKGTTEPKDDHCKDCCCARSWQALGITGYTRKSIPEEITSIREENSQLKVKIAELTKAIEKRS